ncbi:Histone transcription regulator 3 [Candida viswanathii]|uniref:Histone transcription regulator 3 n=1 Tax=Candida viswanathii TaxID=5486 RepID=A0A367XXG6_9ASCO|nr:Histone transcription regulator 3 [Candida viswanathii]
MSSFIPLNSLDDLLSKKDSEEDHTRELQVERAYQLFQSALRLQKQKQYDSAYKVYDDLFKLNIISNHYYEEVDFIRGLQNGSQNTVPDELALTSPNVKSLRYLIFRNRGFLYLEMLKHNSKDTTETKMKDLFYPLLDDFCIALLYNEADEKLLDTLYDIFVYIGSEKLARYTLEYMLSSQKESDDLSGLLPPNKLALTRYKELLGRLQEGQSIQAKLEYLLFLEPIKVDIEAQQAKLNQTYTTTITSSSAKWLDLIDAVNHYLKDKQDENKIEDIHRPKIKSIDPYILSEEPIDRIKVKFGKKEKVEPAQPEPVAKEHPQVAVATVSAAATDEKKTEEDNRVYRSSKRLLRNESELPPTELEKAHFGLMDSFRVKLMDTVPELGLIDVTLSYLLDSDSKKYVKDFLHLLGNWNDHYSAALLSFDSAKSEDDNLKLLDILSGYGSNDETKDRNIPHLGDVDVAIPEVNYVEFKTYIIEHLLTKITTTKWDEKLYSKFTEWIIQFEGYLYKAVEMQLAVAVLEVLVDASISLELHIKETIQGKFNKAVVNGLCQDLLRLNDKIKRWVSYIEDLPATDDNLVSRFKWCLIIKEKSETESWNENVSLRYKLENLATGVRGKIVFPNYNNFIELSEASIGNQLTMISVLSIFWKIFSTSEKDDDNDAIELLESILMEHQEEDNLAIQSIKKFLKQSSIDMRLNLWNILLLFYLLGNLGDKIATGFQECISFLNGYLENDYNMLDEETRLLTLLKILGFYGSSMSLVIKQIKKTNWKLAKPVNIKDLKLFLEFGLFHEINEEASLISSLANSVKPKSVKSYCHLTNMLLKSIILVLACIEKSHYDILHGAIQLFHTQLGMIGICDDEDGAFLEISQEYLKHLPNSEKDICQIIKCKYHYSISVDGFTPVEHDTERLEELNRKDCQELAQFVFPLCFLKGVTINNVPKHDIKMLVDEMYEVVGDPSFEANEVLSRNVTSLRYFLDNTRLTKDFFKNAFYGLTEFELEEPEVDEVANNLYYIEGLLIFSAYKTKKKNLQGRGVELEKAISLFEFDLIHGSNRFESWFLLGQAYGYLVEDDLIWTSDKLTAPERKIATANLQRKSLICYLMAINRSTDESIRDLVKPVIRELMSSFAKEMFGAVQEPMNMHAFKVQSHPRFVQRATGALFESVSATPATSKEVCMKLIQLSLHLAVKSKARDWSDYYYLAKVQRKLGKPAKLVMDTMAKACKHAREHKKDGEFVEPHYSLVSLAYKYVKVGNLDRSAAVRYFEKDPVIKLEVGDEKEFKDLVVKALNKVIAYDTTNTQHKGKYRLARIMYEDFKSVSKATSIMSSFMSLKAANRALIQVWKTESERPGKHFVYTYEYMYFFIELLRQADDLENLIHMLPKLRRSNSIMINLSSVWELLCSSICRVIREALGMPDNFGFTENLINTLSYLVFSSNVKAMTEAMKQKGFPEELKSHLCFLHAVNDMKKANNGYGPTSFIDDTLVTLYFLIYLYYSKDIATPTIVDSPSAKKKIAKRDIFPLTNDVLKLFKTELETLVRLEKFNEFVAEGKQKVEAERKRKQEEQRQLEQATAIQRQLELIQQRQQVAAAHPHEVIVIDDDDDVGSSQEQGNGVKREQEEVGPEPKKIKTGPVIYEVDD